MDICRSLDYYIKNRITAPEVLINYVINVVNNADDTSDDEGVNTDYNTGINRVRGCAVYHLVGCSFMEPYRESIFVALEGLSTSSAVATRCAALFRMAYLTTYDKERTLQLFLAITADYNENILRLPVHNLNPLNYLIKFDFSRLIPYFEHCIDKPNTHRANITWLWIATMMDKVGAKELLFKVGDSSVEGRSSIVKCTQDYYRETIQSLVEEALYRYLPYDERELGHIYDCQFDDLHKWPSTRVLPYLDDFFKAPVVKHCSHHVYRYMKQCADSNAKKALAWLMTLYPYKKNADLEQGEILDVLYTAYNRILVFDKSDKDLEIAMDLLDSFMMSPNESLSALAIKKLGNE